MLEKHNKVKKTEQEGHFVNKIYGIPTFARTTLARRLFRADISAHSFSARGICAPTLAHK
jgi:hypothetical protein